MNTNIESLYSIASKPIRKIIGLMSGTSLDGLDIALCQISGSGIKTQVVVTHFETINYSEDVKLEIRAVFAKKTIDLQHLTLLNEWIGLLHAEQINYALQKWKINFEEVDIIASHGQTVMHIPQTLHGLNKFPNATLQIGDGDHIAVKTGIITISDFRQKHLAAGGEGAPLAVYGDYFLFGKKGEDRIMLNLGGIANFTYLAATMNETEVFVTDTGTGNTLIDAYVRLYFPDLAYDKDAQIAKKGTINQQLLTQLKSDPFFTISLPKTTGPELFNVEYVKRAILKSKTQKISIEDLLATLTRFSAETIAEAIQFRVKKSNLELSQFTIYVSGGGMHNPLLIKYLKALLPCLFKTTDEIGIAGDAKEAVLFAILANETLCGGAEEFKGINGIPSVSMGKISFPR
ncbi:anhydro-N-acetylmuramic acid kinase [Flavobacterium sp. F-380]|uniref:Anhydro-N-acetylmuramic acid kinase n=1 Tax=Flavobacterium kayseriense TaxID=2764714 RepID=A0ABR7JAM4_9FLAO|nr:anhydro-N-acetylmuramic acid kinase [Flavobacterium kayseriense]MBC5842595.1 anhydro-N-acetylmuramic acid kinase [Flavobacterium kayseriense]MBC5849125.1 anhydro-N-acetylmuramic acid kinase [Flavobacterium kayseriense]